MMARDAMNPEAYVAAGMAPPSVGMWTPNERRRSDVELLGRDVLYKEYADQAKVLADTGVDVMLPEYVGMIADCVTAVDACATVDLPVFLGVHSANMEAGLRHGESLQDLVACLEGHRVDAILLMCCYPEAISRDFRSSERCTMARLVGIQTSATGLWRRSTPPGVRI